MTWVGIGSAAVTAVGSYASSKNAAKGNGAYIPGGMQQADNRWQNSNTAQYDLATGAREAGVPAYQTSFDRAMGADWSPYLSYAQRAGQAYGQTGDAAMGQVGQYGQMAGASQGQQAQMYGAAGQVLDTSMDPQGALRARTEQQLRDQVRAGQAARGIGNSAVGAGEEDQAMSNFDIDWNNAQLQRQATGIQAAGMATGAGVNAGRMAGADMSAGLQAGSQGAGYYGYAGSVPMDAYQAWAAAPGTAAASLQGGYANIAQGYAGVASGAIPYMNQGQGALATDYQNRYQQNRDMAAGIGQIAQQVTPAAVKWFNGGGNLADGSGPQQTWDPSNYSTPGGGDPYYGLGQNWGI